MGVIAVELRCPKCSVVTSCDQIKGYSDQNVYTDKQFFEDFTKQKGGFRQRKRQCFNCRAEFLTIEVDEAFLTSLKEQIVHIEDIRKKIENLSLELNNLLELS